MVSAEACAGAPLLLNGKGHRRSQARTADKAGRGQVAACTERQQGEHLKAAMRVVRTEMTPEQKEKALDLLADLLVRMYLSDQGKKFEKSVDIYYD